MTIPIFTFYAAAADIVAGTINLSTDTFYAHLVTAAPTYQDTLVSDLALADYTNYSSVPTSNSSYVSNIWKMDDFLFPVNLGPAQSIHGMVICRQVAGAPSSADQPIVFVRSRENNTLTEFSLDTNQQIRFEIDQTNGVLTRPDRYFFNAGAYVTANDTNGIIYKLGSRNEAQPFSNPSNGSYLVTNNITSQTTPPSSTDSNGEQITNRIGYQNTSLTVDQTRSAFLRFTNNMSIRLKDFSVVVNIGGGDSGSTINVLYFYGAQYLLPGRQLRDSSQYIELGNVGFNATGQTSSNWVVAHNLPGSDIFFDYILISSPDSGSFRRLHEVEFYGPQVTLASPTVDLT